LRAWAFAVNFLLSIRDPFLDSGFHLATGRDSSGMTAFYQL
jgi:hypothetical protein